jgi:hypothetical protein
MHQFEDEDDACRHKEKTSARSDTVARAAESIEERTKRTPHGRHTGSGRRLDWATITAPNDMGGQYPTPTEEPKIEQRAEPVAHPIDRGAEMAVLRSMYDVFRVEGHAT